MQQFRGFTPFDADGNRTYLTNIERRSFLDAAGRAAPKVDTFCHVLVYTGARISEVLELTPEALDFSIQCIVFRCLKKRGKAVFRAVPVPISLLQKLRYVHEIEGTRLGAQQRLWSWCRTTAWARVADVMSDAGLSGPNANSRALRHTFAVSAVQCGVALNMVQKWMGHADIKTTALYADAMGEEELNLAAMMWKKI